jgi:predicted transposase/invertase (TIGR01784 family)
MRTELDRIAELDFARKDGEAKGKAEVAKAMLKDGLKAEKVMAYTGLSKEEIQKLKK